MTAELWRQHVSADQNHSALLQVYDGSDLGLIAVEHTTGPWRWHKLQQSERYFDFAWHVRVCADILPWADESADVKVRKSAEGMTAVGGECWLCWLTLSCDEQTHDHEDEAVYHARGDCLSPAERGQLVNRLVGAEHVAKQGCWCYRGH